MNTGRQQLTSQEISLTFQVCFLVFLVLREGEEKKKKKSGFLQFLQMLPGNNNLNIFKRKEIQVYNVMPCTTQGRFLHIPGVPSKNTDTLQWKSVCLEQSLTSLFQCQKK